MTALVDELTRNQLIATAELACAAVAAGATDTAMLYVPGDAPCVTRQSLRDQLEISTDGRGTFDVWQRHPLRPLKSGLSLADAVAVLGGGQGERRA